MGDVHALQAEGTALDEETLYLAVEAVPDLLQQDMHVGDVTRVLAYGGDGVEDL